MRPRSNDLTLPPYRSSRRWWQVAWAMLVLGYTNIRLRQAEHRRETSDIVTDFERMTDAERE